MGGWVGGWVEEEQGFRTRCWVGGWVGGLTDLDVFGAFEETFIELPDLLFFSF